MNFAARKGARFEPLEAVCLPLRANGPVYVAPPSPHNLVILTLSARRRRTRFCI